MATLVSYQLENSVATITMDDGKVNVLSPQMLAELGAALDRAAADGAVVLLTGRPGVFTAGFDLSVLRAGGDAAGTMIRGAFDLVVRMLAFPAPVVIACTGHAVAMGVFLLLSGDYRVGASGEFKITANEVAIGMTIPQTAVEICRQRLAPAHLSRALLLAEVYSPDGAVAAGFLDRVVPARELRDDAQSLALRLSGLDLAAHAASKQRVRHDALRAIRAALEADFAAFRASA